MVLPYTFLFLAIILEVVGTLFLRDTEGFTKMILHHTKIDAEI